MEYAAFYNKRRGSLARVPFVIPGLTGNLRLGYGSAGTPATFTLDYLAFLEAFLAAATFIAPRSSLIVKLVTSQTSLGPQYWIGPG